MLAALPKAPNTYSTFLHLAKARERQSYVLSRMVEDGYITAQQQEEALRAPIQLRSVRPKQKIAPYFIENVRRYVQGKYGSDVLYKEGLEIYTTLNISMQKSANEAMARGLREIEARGNDKKEPVQGALLCMDAKTGAIRAMVGDAIFTERIQRPPNPSAAGIAFKALIYTAALTRADAGKPPEDSPIAFEDLPRKTVFWKRKISTQVFRSITLETPWSIPETLSP